MNIMIMYEGFIVGHSIKWNQKLQTPVVRSSFLSNKNYYVKFYTFNANRMIVQKYLEKRKIYDAKTYQQQQQNVHFNACQVRNFMQGERRPYDHELKEDILEELSTYFQ